jgi:hypothetical protein
VTPSTNCDPSSCTPPPTSKPPAKPAARTDLNTLGRTAGTRYHPDTGAVTAKADEISRRRITGYLQTSITTGADGKPVFAWSFDQTAIAAAAADGRYVHGFAVRGRGEHQADLAAELARHTAGQPGGVAAQDSAVPGAALAAGQVHVGPGQCDPAGFVLHAEGVAAGVDGLDQPNDEE